MVGGELINDELGGVWKETVATKLPVILLRNRKTTEDLSR
jgi:hypothetical protein